MDIAAVRERFEHFATVEAPDSSPLYAALAQRAIASQELIDLASRAPANQPMPHLLFGAVQYLLRQEGRRFDPTEGVEGAYRQLHRIATERREELLGLLTTKMVQTNEVRRSIYLFASCAYLSRWYPGRKFALLEIGASAGFNLLFDRYRYRFNSGPSFGALDSSVRIDAELLGEELPQSLPDVVIASRTGVDLNPLDPNDEGDADWLRALIWPEHEERRRLLEAALAIRRREEVSMVAGDGVTLLPGLLNAIPLEVVPFVFHTHVANQMSAETKALLLDEVDRQGRRRDVIHLHNSIQPDLHATWYRDGRRFDLTMAQTEGHARWVRWFAPSDAFQTLEPTG